MKNYTLPFTALIMILTINGLSGQSNAESSIPNPTFSPFKGTVYSMPDLEKVTGKLRSVGIQEYYSDIVYTYDSIGFVELDEINITERDIKDAGFPGIEPRVKFAMVLESKMEIELAACYEFKLSSDDGSSLWVNDKLVVNNDGGHQMKTTRDTISLDPGTYNARLWYFQGMPSRLGFIFESKIVGRQNTCHKTLPISEPIRIGLSAIHFDVDHYTLKATGITEIRNIAEMINAKSLSKITITGHTDNTGGSEHNQKLSEQRALAVMNELQKVVQDKSLEYVIVGKGSKEPLSTADTAQARAMNRRVEITLE